MIDKFTKLIRNCMAKFGYYGFKGEYLVDIDEINVPVYMLKSHIGEQKWRRKIQFFHDNGFFESKIIIRRSDWMLVDGYSSYKICKRKGIKKVPVYFVD